MFKIKFKHLIESFDSQLISSNELINNNSKEFATEKNKNDEKNFTNQKFDKTKNNYNYSQYYDEFDDNEGENYPEKSKKLPPIILNIWGRISEEKYNKFKSNSSWMDLTTKVCMDCYLNFTRMFCLYYYKINIFNYYKIIIL